MTQVLKQLSPCTDPLKILHVGDYVRIGDDIYIATVRQGDKGVFLVNVESGARLTSRVIMTVQDVGYDCEILEKVKVQVIK